MADARSLLSKADPGRRKSDSARRLVEVAPIGATSTEDELVIPRYMSFLAPDPPPVGRPGPFSGLSPRAPKPPLLGSGRCG